jgi:ATP-dependent DNA ligase
LGETAEIQLTKKKQSTFFSKKLTVEHVYDTLDKMAKTTGSGAVDTKMAVFAACSLTHPLKRQSTLFAQSPATCG